MDKPCNVCGGEGKMEKKVMERIVIPANARKGQKYIYRNKGDQGVRNHKSGSLIIEIGGLSKTNFDIYKNDIMMYKTIDIEVNNMEKIFKVNVKPGIKSGDIYKIDKMGMVNENKKVIGDYYIKFKVV
jgi:molecular chaperone DnaJ